MHSIIGPIGANDAAPGDVLKVRYKQVRPFNWGGLQQPGRAPPYLMAIGLIGEPTAFVMGSGGAVKKNSYTPSSAQSSASSFR